MSEYDFLSNGDMVVSELNGDISVAITNVNTRNDNTTVQGDIFGSGGNINWKALYKLLESEVEELAFDPNAPQFVKDWARNLIAKLRTRVSPRDLL